MSQIFRGGLRGASDSCQMRLPQLYISGLPEVSWMLTGVMAGDGNHASFGGNGLFSGELQRGREVSLRGLMSAELSSLPPFALREVKKCCALTQHLTLTHTLTSDNCVCSSLSSLLFAPWVQSKSIMVTILLCFWLCLYLRIGCGLGGLLHRLFMTGYKACSDL